MGETPGKNGAGRRASVFSGPDRLKAGRRTRFVAWVEREREIGTGVPGAKVGFKVGDGDH